VRTLLGSSETEKSTVRREKLFFIRRTISKKGSWERDRNLADHMSVSSKKNAKRAAKLGSTLGGRKKTFAS